MLKSGYMNIYRSGYFHREGKPGNIDRHGGDVYDDKTTAEKHIFPQSHFITTIPVQWEDPEECVVNAQDSIPVALSVSRKRFNKHQQEESTV